MHKWPCLSRGRRHDSGKAWDSWVKDLPWHLPRDTISIFVKADLTNFGPLKQIRQQICNGSFRICSKEHRGKGMDIKKALLVLMHLGLSSDYRLIRRLKVFDPGYYLALLSRETGDGQIPPAVQLDPLWHFFKKYSTDHLPVVTPESGWRQLADPHPLFDTAFYLLRYFPQGFAGNPFVHYLRLGWREGKWPGPFFDPEVYKSKSSWDQKLGNPLSHYSSVGSRQGISPGNNFDIGWYHDRNPALADVQHEIIKHYKLHGAGIGKSPLPVFDPLFYLKQLGGSAGEVHVSDPFSHYITTGAARGLRPGAWFDAKVYREKRGKSSDAADVATALSDYLERGVHDRIATDKRIDTLTRTPVFSLLVPVYNPDPGVLNSCIRSVVYQAYPHWELCLADDGSTRDGVKETLEYWTARDKRIKVLFLAQNAGISAATNAAASIAEGDFVGFLDNDDELSIDCLYQVARAINESDAEVIYSDEDLIGDDGTQLSVFRKPDFNNELLLSHNYITHFVAATKALFDLVGGFRPEYDGAQDFDLMLRLSEVAGKIHHIPQILYHWRASETSTSVNHGEKDYAHEAGRKAVAQAILRRGIAGDVVDSGLNFFYKIERAGFPCPPSALFVLLDDFDPQAVEATARSLQQTAAENCVVSFVVSREAAGMNAIPEALSASGMEVLFYEKQKGRAQFLNEIILQKAPDLLIFSEGTEAVYLPGWQKELCGVVAGQGVAMSCGRKRIGGGDGLSYSLPDISNSSAQYYHEFLHSAARHANGLHCQQAVSCCGGDLVMISRELFVQEGGFDAENFPHLFSVLDLSLRMKTHGGKLIYTPSAQIEKMLKRSAASAADEPVDLHNEKKCFQEKWRNWLLHFDPFYNSAILEDNGIVIKDFRDWLAGSTIKSSPE